MTLFITTPNRRYEISDAYVMGLTFFITYWVTRIAIESIEKRRKHKEKEKKKITSIRGGKFQLTLSDENDFGLTILSCIADNESYLVTSPRIKELIFRLAKEKIKNESLVITPNLIRFFALTLLNKKESLIVKIGNVVGSSENRARFLTRVIGASLTGIFAAASTLVPYAVLVTLFIFIETENCGYNCDDYFQKLPTNDPVEVCVERPNGNLVLTGITGNDDARQVEVYIPSESVKEIPEINPENIKEKIVKKIYRRTRKKAKEVKFSEFRKTDPILSQFENLEEPIVPQRSCPFTDDSIAEN